MRDKGCPVIEAALVLLVLICQQGYDGSLQGLGDVLVSILRSNERAKSSSITTTDESNESEEDVAQSLSPPFGL